MLGMHTIHGYTPSSQKMLGHSLIDRINYTMYQSNLGSTASVLTQGPFGPGPVHAPRFCPTLENEQSGCTSGVALYTFPHLRRYALSGIR